MKEQDLPTLEQVLDYWVVLMEDSIARTTQVAKFYQQTGTIPEFTSLFPELNLQKTHHTLWEYPNGQTIELDLEARRISNENQIIVNLTPSENKLLKVFLHSNNRTLTHVEIVNRLSPGWDKIYDDNDIEIRKKAAPEMTRHAVNCVRRKLQYVNPFLRKRIVSLRGTGYYWGTQAEIEKFVAEQEE